jgi:Kef-type K+ transport system membrane component KefB
VLIGPYLANVITEPVARQLQAVTGLATTLIALIAGLMINVERLRSRLGAIATMTGFTLGLSGVGLLAAAWLAWPWLPVAPDAAGLPKLAMALLLVVSVISFSPTMTAAVIAETGARGRLSELVLAIVVLADVVGLVLFSLSMQLARCRRHRRRHRRQSAGPPLGLGGAVAFGSLVGAGFALYCDNGARSHARAHRGACC